MDSKAKRFKSAEEDLRNCSQFPEVYDLMRDRCYGKRSEYESQRSAYNSQLSDLRSKLEDVDYKIRSVNNSCGVSLTAALGPPPKVPAGVSRPDQCALYLRYKGSLPLQTIVDVCSKQMPADECRKCLQ